MDDNARRLQILAVIVLIISYLAAFSAAGNDLGNGFSFFVNGRYALIYAFFLIGISLLLSPKQIVGNARLASIPEIGGLILLVLAPIVFYSGLKIPPSFFGELHCRVSLGNYWSCTLDFRYYSLREKAACAKSRHGPSTCVDYDLILLQKSKPECACAIIF